MSDEAYQRDERLLQDALKINHIQKDPSSSTSPFHCNVCKMPFTGRKPMLQHLVSVKHNKKAAVLGTSSPEATSVVNETEAVRKAFELGHVRSASGSSIGASFCDICQVPLSGEAPLRQHVISPNHAKKLRNKLGSFNMSGIKNALSNIGIIEEKSPIVIEAIEDGHVSEDKLSSGAYFCNICKVPLTGVKPLEQHLQGSNHLRQTRQNYQFQILPEVTNKQGDPESVASLLEIFPEETVEKLHHWLAAAEGDLEAATTLILENQLQDDSPVFSNKTFTRIIPMNQHITSESQMMNLRTSPYKDNSPPNASLKTYGSSSSRDLFKAQISDIRVIYPHEPLDGLFN